MKRPEKRRKRKIFSILILAGLAALAIAGGITGHNFYTEYEARKTASATMDELTSQINEDDKDNSYLIDPNVPMKTITINGIKYVGVLDIPSLDLKLPIISEWSDSLLKVSPCRYDGTPYQDHFIIAGHNYGAHFGRLMRLAYGSQVSFTDVDNNVFTYEVGDMETMRPTDIDQMDTGNWNLTLFTCNYTGRARVAVRCYSVDY